MWRMLPGGLFPRIVLQSPPTSTRSLACGWAAGRVCHFSSSWTAGIIPGQKYDRVVRFVLHQLQMFSWLYHVCASALCGSCMALA